MAWTAEHKRLAVEKCLRLNAERRASNRAFARSRIAHAERVTGRRVVDAMGFNAERLRKCEASLLVRAEFCAAMLEPDENGRAASPNEVAAVLGISRYAVNNGAARWAMRAVRGGTEVVK